MKKHLTAKTTVAMAALTALCATWMGVSAQAQSLPVTEGQRAAAQQIAKAGVPLSELAADAPSRYTVKSRDTLWDISKLFLNSPWRWPELWGMNLEQIRNPHLIYPGQVLVLVRENGRATLQIEGASAEGSPPDMQTVRVSPRNRYESLADTALPTLRASAIEPFLAEPIIVSEAEFQNAPRIVAAQEGRVLLTRGDRAYARGTAESPFPEDTSKNKLYRVFRTATPLKDPDTGAVLGFEATYAGKAALVRGESTTDVTERDGKVNTSIVPATIDIYAAKEEIRVGDRLFPEPPREFQFYTPHPPASDINARIVSVYGSAVQNAAQNQVVVINRGKADGLDTGTVMAILSDGARVIDKQDAERPLMKLPDERNGLLMVFRTFDHLSYALILEIKDATRVGDRLVSPR